MLDRNGVDWYTDSWLLMVCSRADDGWNGCVRYHSTADDDGGNGIEVKSNHDGPYNYGMYIRGRLVVGMDCWLLEQSRRRGVFCLAAMFAVLL